MNGTSARREECYNVPASPESLPSRENLDSLSRLRLLFLMTALIGGADFARAESNGTPPFCASPEQIRRLEDTIKKLDPASPLAKRDVPELMAVVADRRCPRVLRQRAGMLLGRIGEPAIAAVAVLARLLDGDDRGWVLKSLGLFGGTASQVVGRLSRELRDESRGLEDRTRVADVLGQIGTGPAIEALGRELLRNDPGSAADAAKARLLRKTMLNAIAIAGPKAVGALPALIRSLENPDTEIRRRACQAIGRLGPRAEPAIDSIFERLALDEAPEVQDAAAEALGRLGPTAVPVLLRIVRDAPPDLQWRAARTLGRSDRVRRARTEKAEAVREMTGLFDSDDGRVRVESMEAVWRLERRAGPVAMPLVKELASPERQNRMAAARVLVEMDELPSEAERLLQKLSAASSAEGRSAREVLRKRTLRGAD